MSGWKRKRHPDDVPTPIAVAVADFCRRAKAPASPAIVREALALLTDEQDARVRSITDAEPKAIPLGPFAVVDLVKGTPAGTAAERQSSGYYEMARVAAEDEDEVEEPSAPAKPAPAPRPSAPKRTAKEPRERKVRLTVAERIAPKKRVPGQQQARPRPQQPLPGTAFLPKRNLPAPRGRFTRLDSSRSTYEALLKVESRDALTAIVEQSATRYHVFQTIEPGYSGRAGAPLTVADVEGALTRHQLLGVIEKKEREKILAALTEARGSGPIAAKELGIKVQELDGLVHVLRLKKESTQIKDRFVREALDPANLSLRLTLLGRQRYLADLQMEKRFTDALTRDVTKLLDDSAEAATTVHELVMLTAKKHALVPDLLNRAVDRLGLTRRYTR